MARAGGSVSGRPLALTFDDGFADFYTTVLPILKEFGCPATLYVPTAYIGGSAGWLWECGEAHRQILSWRALGQVAAEGVEVASHSHTHRQLDRVSRSLLQDEVERSKKLLEDRLGQEIHGFAYPFGYWNRAARSAVKSAGYLYGCAVGELSHTPVDHLLTMPRLSVNEGIGVQGVANLLESQSRFRQRKIAAGKRVAWQVIRKVRHAPKLGPTDGQSL